MIRNREMVPNAENINFLLLASDALKNLIINVHESDQIDITEHMEALSSITEATPSQEKTDPPKSSHQILPISHYPEERHSCPCLKMCFQAPARKANLFI